MLVFASVIISWVFFQSFLSFPSLVVDLISSPCPWLASCVYKSLSLCQFVGLIPVSLRCFSCFSALMFMDSCLCSPRLLVYVSLLCLVSRLFWSVFLLSFWTLSFTEHSLLYWNSPFCCVTCLILGVLHVGPRKHAHIVKHRLQQIWRRKKGIVACWMVENTILHWRIWRKETITSMQSLEWITYELQELKEVLKKQTCFVFSSVSC